MKRRVLYPFLLCAALLVGWMCLSSTRGDAQSHSEYVGSDVCGTCHTDLVKSWALTVHRRTLFNESPSKKGCEGCHGPGGEHVAGGGDVSKIVRFEKLKPGEADAICLKCHNNQDVTLWQTSLHSRARLSCTNCHDPHQPGEKLMLKNIDDAKLPLEGLTRAIQQSQLASNTAAKDSKAKEDAEAQVAKLTTERKGVQDKIKGLETIYERTAEPYMCYNCHKTQKVQTRMASHHPIPDGKMKCSSCHNPHGGPKGMLREESVLETCRKCHAEKTGPFTFEHPPVGEDCTICHNPHGSVQNNLLVQSEPFLCLKCHAGPHSRGGALANPVGFAQFYTECTNCHNQIHGSDNHAAFHF